MLRLVHVVTKRLVSESIDRGHVAARIRSVNAQMSFIDCFQHSFDCATLYHTNNLKLLNIYRMSEEHNISEKVKEYLRRKLDETRHRLKKLKRKRKIIKVIYISTVVSSIVISAVVASLTSLISVPIIVIIVLSAGSAILTGVSSRFNFQNKKYEINIIIDRLNKIQSKLDYVISCNGDLTHAEYQQILKDFNF